MSGIQGDIGSNGNFLKSTKRNLRGFVDIEFQHSASIGDTGFNLLNLNQPVGVVNPSPNKLADAIKEGNLQLFNGSGKNLAIGTDYVISGTSITFNGFTALEGEIFHGMLKNSPIQGSISLLDGVPLSPSGFLEVGQTTFNLGRAVPINGVAESIIVLRNRTQLILTEDYTFVDPNNTGFAQLIQLIRPGELLPGGGKEFIQVFANGFIVENQPTGVNSKLDQFRGRLDRMTNILETNLAIDPLSILLGAPSNEDLKFFGDTVNKILNMEVPIVTPWTSYSPIITGSVSNPTKGTTTIDRARWRQNGQDAEIVYEYAQTSAGTAGSGLYEFSIPPNLSIDTNLIQTSGGTGKGTIGTFSLLAATSGFQGLAFAITNNAFSAQFLDSGLASGLQKDFSSSNASFANSPLQFVFTISVPIVGFKATQTIRQALGL